MKIFTISLLLLAGFTLTTYSQITFQKSYGAANLEEGTSVLALPDGYLITGSTASFGAGGQDVFAMKTDLYGTEIWSRVYGGPQHDEGFSVQPTYDGGFIIAGITLSYTGPSALDHSNIYLLKIDGVGNLLWSKTIHSGELDAAYSVKETSDKGFVITGYTGSFVSGPDNLLLVKTDSLGVTEWTRILGSASSSVDVGRAVIQTRDGGYAVAGFSTAFTPPGDTAAFLAILNPAGNVMFTRHIAITNIGSSVPSPQTAAYDIIQNTDGNLVIAGAAGGIHSGVVYACFPAMILTDSIGNYISAKIYSLNSGDCKFQSVQQTADGGYIAGGFMGNYFPMMLKTDSVLDKQWCYYYGNYAPPGNLSDGRGFAAAQSTDGGYVIAGYKNENPDRRIHLIKADATGVSGCNQGIPIFLGSGGNAPVNAISGTVFSPGFSSYFDIISPNVNVAFTDSIFCISTALNEISGNSFSTEIYPNPAKDQVTIGYTIRESEKLSCSLINSTGQLVFKTEVSGNKNVFSIDTSLLSSGVYHLELYDTSGASFNSKLVVIH